MGSDRRINHRKCSVDGCQKPSEKRDMCFACYVHWWKYGYTDRKQIIELKLTKESAKRKLIFRRRIDTKTGCWIYMGKLTDKGYAHVGIAGKVISAHRLAAYAWKSFDLNSDLHVLHDCPDRDNPSCFNPDHLWIGKNSDNMRDAREKGSFTGDHSRGSLNTNAKLTEDNVKKIKEMLKNSARGIHKFFGVSRSVISSIKNGRTWKHVTVNGRRESIR